MFPCGHAVCETCTEAVEMTPNPRCPVCPVFVGDSRPSAPAWAPLAAGGSSADESVEGKQVREHARELAAEFRAATAVTGTAQTLVEAVEEELERARVKAVAAVRSTAREVELAVRARQHAAELDIETTFKRRRKALHGQIDALGVTKEQLTAAGTWCERVSGLPDESLEEILRAVAVSSRMRLLCDADKEPCEPALLEVFADTVPVMVALEGMVRVAKDWREVTAPLRSRMCALARGETSGVERLMSLLGLTRDPYFTRFPQLWHDWSENTLNAIDAWEKSCATPVIMGELARVFGDVLEPTSDMCCAWVAVVNALASGCGKAKAVCAFDNAGGMRHLLWILMVFLAGKERPAGLWETASSAVVNLLIQAMALVSLPTVVADAPGMFAAVCGMMDANPTVVHAQRAGLWLLRFVAANGEGEISPSIQAAVVEHVARCFGPVTPSEDKTLRKLSAEAFEAAAWFSLRPLHVPSAKATAITPDHLVSCPLLTTTPTACAETIAQFLDSILMHAPHATHAPGGSEWFDRWVPPKPPSVSIAVADSVRARCWLPHVLERMHAGVRPSANMLTVFGEGILSTPAAERPYTVASPWAVNTLLMSLSDNQATTSAALNALCVLVDHADGVGILAACGENLRRLFEVAVVQRSIVAGGVLCAVTSTVVGATAVAGLFDIWTILAKACETAWESDALKTLMRVCANVTNPQLPSAEATLARLGAVDGAPFFRLNRFGHPWALDWCDFVVNTAGCGERFFKAFFDNNGPSVLAHFMGVCTNEVQASGVLRAMRVLLGVAPEARESIPRVLEAGSLSSAAVILSRVRAKAEEYHAIDLMMEDICAIMTAAAALVPAECKAASPQLVVDAYVLAMGSVPRHAAFQQACLQGLVVTLQGNMRWADAATKTALWNRAVCAMQSHGTLGGFAEMLAEMVST